MTLASPFVKGGSRGILLSHRLLIFKNNFLIDQISPNPSLLKRGNKKNTFTVSQAKSQPLEHWSYKTEETIILTQGDSLSINSAKNYEAINK